MGMNKTNGNMYPWVSHTWNPVGGKCKHNCKYCYMKNGFLGKLDKYKGDIEIIEEELGTNLGIGNVIFVGSAIDLFGDFVPKKIIKRILNYCKKYSMNTYLFQSKNPRRIGKFIEKLPEGSIIGTTLETNRNYNVSNAPKPKKRYMDFKEIDYPRKMVSIEPIMDFNFKEFTTWIEKINPEFVSIGADSKGSGLEEPDSDKIVKLIDRLKELTEVRKKDNLSRLSTE